VVISRERWFPDRTRTFIQGGEGGFGDSSGLVDSEVERLGRASWFGHLERTHQ
jgi:hypothetical protein